MTQSYFAASCSNRHQVVELLLLQEGCDVNEGNSRGYTPVHEAALAGYSEFLNYLLIIQSARLMHRYGHQ